MPRKKKPGPRRPRGRPRLPEDEQGVVLSFRIKRKDLVLLLDKKPAWEKKLGKKLSDTAYISALVVAGLKGQVRREGGWRSQLQHQAP